MTNEILNRPWSLLAYIKDLIIIGVICSQWNHHGKNLVNQEVLNGIIDPRMLAQRASEIVENNSELTLVLHF